MRNIRDYKVGDIIEYKSYEGIKERGRLPAIDIWENIFGEWYATLSNGYKVVCVRDNDLLTK